MVCIMPPQHSAKIFARRISTSLFRCRLQRRMTPVREERLDYIFSLRITGHTGCLRVCLSLIVSCTRRSRFTFVSGTNTMSRHVHHWISFQVLEWRVCMRARKVGNSHDIRSFFRRMTAPHCLLDTISTVSLLFIRLKERGRRDANAKRKVWIPIGMVQWSKN